MAEYNKTNWQNSPSTKTPISAENLNKLENAMADVWQQVDLLSSLPYVRVLGCTGVSVGRVPVSARSEQRNGLIVGEIAMIVFENDVNITADGSKPIRVEYLMNEWSVKGDITGSYKTGDILILYASSNNNLTVDDRKVSDLKTELTARINSINASLNEMGASLNLRISSVEKKISAYVGEVVSFESGKLYANVSNFSANATGTVFDLYVDSDITIPASGNMQFFVNGSIVGQSLKNSEQHTVSAGSIVEITTMSDMGVPYQRITGFNKFNSAVYINKDVQNIKDNFRLENGVLYIP